MRYKAIMFDMDGTLLPMDMNEFTNGYFKELNKKLAKYGMDPKKLVQAIWIGTEAMVRNDGTQTNEQVFWKKFEETTGVGEELVGADCLEFYGKEFHVAKKFTGENPLAKKAVEIAREKAEQVILATNPLFPMAGQITRMSWIGLTPADFDHVSCFEEDHYCKPNPKYFLSICEMKGLKPEECLMIGNDETEDMYAASSIGMDCYLVTDCEIKSEKHPWEGPKGTFPEMVEMLKSL